MNSPFNLSRYNLVGYNITPTGTIYASATFSERIRFISVSSVANVYPKINLFETVSIQRAELVPGRFITAGTSESVNCTKALGIGCSWRRLSTDELISGQFVGNRYFWRKAASNDALNTERMTIIGAYWDDAEYSDEIDVSTAVLIGCSWREASYNDAFNSSAGLSSVVFIPVGTNDSFVENAHLSEIVFGNAEAGSTITGKRLQLSSEVYQSADALDLIDAHCDVLAQEILTCILTTALGPGQTMVIDAATYNILIDGVNAVYTHSGDWLDELNRNTINFVINAASGRNNISATIFYTERYL